MATQKTAKTKPVKQARTKSPKKDTQKAMATVFIMGTSHEVPADATIMGAIEYAGYQRK